jgi:hypothetical protein
MHPHFAKAPPKRRGKRRNRFQRLALERLESRRVAAGDLQLTGASWTAFDGSPIEQVFVGEQIFLRADWKAANLATTDRYVVRFSVDDDPLDSSPITPASGAGGGAGSDGNVNLGGLTADGRFWRRGAWFAAPGVHTVTVVLDPENSVAETNENNNAMTLTLHAAAPVLPDKLIWPVGGEAQVDWVCCNYLDLDRGPGVRDFRGQGFALGSHTGLDIGLANWSPRAAC